MKILSVTLHNIASIEGPFTLDLEGEPLKSVGLFAITGATGAGKSTILDAICLALYNDTPRLAATKSTLFIADGSNEVQVNNVKNLLRKGATVGYVKVQFLAVDNKEYEAQWQVKRAHGKHNGSIQNEVLQLTCLTDNQPYPENRKTLVLEKIKSLIGLSFDEFTKSVILAQGDFTSFLKANDDKRSDILEKLTSTEIYSKLSKQIYEINKEKQHELQLIEVQLNNTQLLTKDELDSLKENLIIDEESLVQVQKQLTTLKAQQQWFTDMQLYQHQLEEAKLRKEKASEKKTTQYERFALLAKVEQAQAIKTDFSDYERENKHLNDIKKQLTTAEAEKEYLTHEKATHFNLKSSAENKLITVQNTYSEAKPSIEKAKALDVQLQEVSRNLNTKETEIADKEKCLEEKKEALTTIISRLSSGQAFIKQEEIWCQTNTDAEKLYNSKIWITKLAEDQQQLLEELDKNQYNQHQIEAQLTALTSQTPELSDDNISVTNLNKRRQEERLLLQHYQQDKTTAERWETYLLQIEKKDIELALLVKKIKELEKEVSALQPKTQSAQIACDMAEVIYQRTQLEQSNNVVALREQLEEGKPCLVCGAIEHPNAHKDFSTLLINTVKEEYLKAKKTLEQLQKELTTKETQLKEQLQHSNTLQKEIINDKANAEKVLQELRNSKYFSQYPAKDIAAYIGQQIERVQQEQQTTDFLLDLFNKYRILSETLKTLADKTSIFKQQIAKNNQKIANIELSEEINSLWNKNLTSFIKRVTEAQKMWENHWALLDKYQKAVEVITREHTKLNTEITTLKKDLDEQKFVLNEEQQVFKTLTTKREKLLEGKKAEEVESSFEQQINKLKAEVTDTQNIYNAILLQIAANDKSIESLKDDQEKTKKIIAVSTERINHWIAIHYPKEEMFAKEQLPLWTGKSIEWLQTERTALQELNETIARYSTIVTEKEEQLNCLLAKRPTKLSEEETKNSLEIELSNEEKLQERVVNAKSRLIADNKERLKADNLYQEKAKKIISVQRWDKLSNLIGSASGMSFRKYAQEYTLDILLQYANAQMKYINKRYTLQRIPNSLSLQVVDNDMGAEIRSVYSLSGGESFLVSLALALALSSLSSTQMNIETMFIDEGFGSLDSNTLSVALDALESLQNQGKKVGVISHVQEMVERIAVKVIVQKEGNGKSSIMIE